MSASVLITYHSSAQAIADTIKQRLESNGLDVFIVSENEPVKLNDRASLIQICDAFLVLTSPQYQKTKAVMELLHYAKDLKKKLFAINLRKSYVPFGALGAIVASANGGLFEFENNGLDGLTQELSKLSKPANGKRFAEFKSTANDKSDLVYSNTATDVLISHHPETDQIAELIHEALNKESIQALTERSTKGVSSVRSCKALIVIMSQGYEADLFCREVVEEARRLSLDIIPISITKSWKPESWLGLVIGGTLFYRVFNRDQAYEKFYDSTPMNNLVYGIKTTLADQPSTEEIEKAEIESLQKRIDDCKEKLPSWPPKHQEPKRVTRPVKIMFEEPKGELELFHQHYEVTRMTFAVPKPLFDKHGVPIRKVFDCMISYQWDKQELVRNIYMDLHMKNLTIWFDIWGGMEGNSNEAMATAIECSKVIIVFLTDKYQKSINCQLEFKYAVARGKPFVFVMVEPEIKIESWLEPYFNTPEFPKYEMRSLDDEGILHNNIPRIDVIAQAIRAIGQVQPDDDVSDLSEDVFNLKTILSDALNEIAQNSGKQRFKTCTRCKKQFDDNNSSGCKMHSAYYLGGSIIQGRWVCCQQPQSSLGCRDSDHIDVSRAWTCDHNYGTYSWIPQ